VTIFLYTLRTTDRTSKRIRARLNEWEIKYIEEPVKNRPNPSWILVVDEDPYTAEEIRTRDMLWKAIHPAPPEIDPAQVPSFCPDQPDLLTEENVNLQVFTLVQGGDKEISKYFNSLSPAQQFAFIVAVRLQRHNDARLLKDFGDMVTDWLNNKANSLDQYVGWKPKSESRLYMWWVE
jgi:hypothetical protein